MYASRPARTPAPGFARGHTPATRWWLGAILALTLGLALVLGGCAARHNGSSVQYGPSQQTNSSQTNASSSGLPGTSTQQVQSADQQTHDALNALESAQNDANTDFSSQDSETLP